MSQNGRPLDAEVEPTVRSKGRREVRPLTAKGHANVRQLYANELATSTCVSGVQLGREAP